MIESQGGAGHAVNPLAPRVSGLYMLQSIQSSPGSPSGFPMGQGSLSPFSQKEELRLDVDGYLPQMTASGTLFSKFGEQSHWIAGLQQKSATSWAGRVWYMDGGLTRIARLHVTITVTQGLLGPMSAKVVFRSSPKSKSFERICIFKFRSPFFRSVEFEFDSVEGLSPVTQIETRAHPNCPAHLPAETLSIETTFQRAGFDVRRTGGGGKVPLSAARAGGTWSDMEMHDAMQAYWSRFADRPQWSMWVLFAGQHDDGHGLGGVMFDDIGPQHRQGTSIFYDSFVSEPPAADPASDAAVDRMRFWTAVHEMGHAFNLAHSWQKELGVPWQGLLNEPEVRSFMNYPYRVSGGPTAFFADFAYAFSPGELLFMRHAPSRFVEMGNASWFDHHGFEQANVSPEPSFKLELRTNRQEPTFEFLEPVVVELKLTNLLNDPQLIPERLLQGREDLVVVIKKEGQPSRRLVPYAHYCLRPGIRVLQPRESLYDSLFLSVGRNGWNISEPGYYTVQVALSEKEEDVVSQPLRLRVLPPRGYDEQLLAQDFFSDEVGRIVTFDGSRVMERGNAILQEIVEKLPERRVAVHAQVALGMPTLRPYKLLRASDGGSTPRLEVQSPDYAQARSLVQAMVERGNWAAESLGHVDYNDYMARLSHAARKLRSPEEAEELDKATFACLKSRRVPAHRVSQGRERGLLLKS
jgi:hypothetical protein